MGQTIARLDRRAADDLVRSGTATAGMVAKLRACRVALDGGVADVAIADVRNPKLLALVAGKAADKGGWTRLT